MARTTQEEKARKTAEIVALLEAKELGIQAIAAKVGCSTRLVMSIKNGNGNTENGNGNEPITITGLNSKNVIEQVTITPTTTPQVIPLGPIVTMGEDGSYHSTGVNETPDAVLIDAPPINIFEGKAPTGLECPCEDEVAGMNVKVWMALGAAKAALEWVNSYKAFKKRPCKKRFEAAIELINEATN